MSGKSAGDGRQNGAMPEDAAGMLAMLPRLLEEHAALKASHEATAREIDGLRREMGAVRAEIQTSTVERTEFQTLFAPTMNEVIDLINQVVPRLQAQPRRSPFGRDAGAAGEPADVGPAPAARS